MADINQYDILKSSKDFWNDWMKTNWKELPTIKSYSKYPLRNHKVENLSLTVADLSSLDLRDFQIFDGYNFKRVLFNNCNLGKLKFLNCNFKKAQFRNADLREVIFENCTFEFTTLINANLNQSSFHDCKLIGANLSKAEFYKANFNNTILVNCNLMWSKLIETNFKSSSVNKCHVFGASIWNINAENTLQTDIIITKREEIEVSVDNLEIAQFLYLMINNKNIKNIIETLTSKIVLILGRFSGNRKIILDQIKDELRTIGYVPIIFEFQKPDNKDYLEPVLLISQLSRFIIADFSDPKIILEEIPRIVDNTSAVIIPIIEKGQREPSTLYNIRINRLSILDTYIYESSKDLLENINTELINKAEIKLKELHERRIKYAT